MSRSKTVLCLVYAAIALFALVATWSQNVAYFHPGAAFFDIFATFINETKVNPASRSIAVDIVLIFLAAAIFMVIEGRKQGVRLVWAYIVFGALVAISVTFPLFLLAREMRLAEDPRIPALDLVPLLAFSALTVWLTVYIAWL